MDPGAPRESSARSSCSATCSTSGPTRRHVRPPSMGDIIAANRSLLGPRGPLAAVVRALPGRVRMLLGNHDGSLTRADIDRAQPLARRRSLPRASGSSSSRRPWRVVTGASGARTVFTHGHHWCMFNAPDARSRWGTIPVGHFVTRAIGYQLSRTLRPGETAADRRNSGNPNGVDLARPSRAGTGATISPRSCSRTSAGITGMPQTERIVMPDGSATTAQDAMRVFAGLFTQWVAREGRPLDALRAAAADWRGEDLAWFAQRLALQTASDLAVMGHTHVPVGGLTVSPANYVNSGYECVARPDAPAQAVHVHAGRPRARHARRCSRSTRTGGGVHGRARPRAGDALGGPPPVAGLLVLRPDREPLRPAVAAGSGRQGRRLVLGRPAAAADPAALARGHLGAGLDRAERVRRPLHLLRRDADARVRRRVPDGRGQERRPLAGPELPDEDRKLGLAHRRSRLVRAPGAGALPSSRRCARPADARRRRPGGQRGARGAGRQRDRRPAIAARILWPALGFPAVVAPRSAPRGPSGGQHSVCVLLLSDRPTLTAEDAARHLRIVRWDERTRRRIDDGQPGSFSAAELTVRSGAAAHAAAEGRPRRRGRLRRRPPRGLHRREPVARGPRLLRRRQGLRHLHEIRVSEAASGRLPDGQYHLLWNGSAAAGRRTRCGCSSTRSRSRAGGGWRRHGGRAALAPAEPRLPGRRVPIRLRRAPPAVSGRATPSGGSPRCCIRVFVRRKTGSLKVAHLTDTHIDVRTDVYEHNLAPAPAPMSAVGGLLRYRGAPVRFNNWNRVFSRLYEDAKGDAEAILITGDLIDYGRGHLGLVDGGRHRHELGVDGRTTPTATGSSSTTCSPRDRATRSPSTRSSATTTGGSTPTRRSRPALPIPRRSCTTPTTSTARPPGLAQGDPPDRPRPRSRQEFVYTDIDLRQDRREGRWLPGPEPGHPGLPAPDHHDRSSGTCS